MAAAGRTHVEVYVFRRRGRRIEHLALRRSPDARKLPGVWQPVTGKARAGERAAAAALRELREETGLRPRRFWALETVITYYEPAADAVRFLPLFAAEADPRAVVRLSREHDAFAWLPAAGLARRVLWEMQRRGLAAVRREVLARPRLAAALEVTGRVAAGPAARRRRPERP